MIKINKHPSPQVLTKYQSDPSATYESISSEDKSEIRLNLLEEQGYLCAYCMRRIEISSSTIEHWSAQHPADGEDDRTKALDYNNMFAVCYGNRGKEHKYQTCDAHKGNTELIVYPCNQAMINTIKYRSNGYVFSEDEAINHDLNGTLNLNCEEVSLPQNRKSALDALCGKIEKECRKGEKKATICRSIIRKYGGQEKKIEYWGIIEWKLNKWLAQQQSK